MEGFSGHLGLVVSLPVNYLDIRSREFCSGSQPHDRKSRDLKYKTATGSDVTNPRWPPVPEILIHLQTGNPYYSRSCALILCLTPFNDWGMSVHVIDMVWVNTVWLWGFSTLKIYNSTQGSNKTRTNIKYIYAVSVGWGNNNREYHTLLLCKPSEFGERRGIYLSYKRWQLTWQG